MLRMPTFQVHAPRTAAEAVHLRASLPNSLFVAGLRGVGIYRLEIKGDKVVAEEPMLTEQKLRMRDLKIGPDGAVYALAERGKLFKLTPP